jgi:hypothetical protein
LSIAYRNNDDKSVRGTREKAPKTSRLAWLLGIACFQRRLMEKHMHKQDPEEEEEDHCVKRERMITMSYAGLERSSWYGFPEAVGMICAGSNKEEKKNSQRSVFCSTVESLSPTHTHIFHFAEGRIFVEFDQSV